MQPQQRLAERLRDELSYLHDAGRAVVDRHPQLAPLLGATSDDPDVRHLTHAFAFLTARIQLRLDDAAPEVVSGLTQVLAPQLLEGAPATSIVEFTPPLRATRSVRTIPRGTALAAREVDGVSCRFRTCRDVQLVPAAIDQVVLDGPTTAPVLRVQLVTNASGKAAIPAAGELEFHIHGDHGIATTLLLWLVRRCSAVTIAAGGAATRLPGSAVVARSDRGAILEWPGRAPPVFRRVLEAFVQPAGALFFAVRGLEGLEVASDRIELAFHFREPLPTGVSVTRESLRLHCTPVVNLFAAPAIPVRIEPGRTRHLVRPSGFSPGHAEVARVTSVVGLGRPGDPRRRVYRDFFAFVEPIESPVATNHSYVIHRSAGPYGAEMSLELTGPRDQTPPPVEQVLSVELLCTNGDLVTQLHVGDIDRPGPDAPALPPLRNITPVTAPMAPAMDDTLRWRWVAQLSLAAGSIADASTLRATLSLFNLPGHLGRAEGIVVARQIAAIEAVESRTALRVIDGAPIRGLCTRVTIHDAGLASVGEAFLLGQLLDALLAAYVRADTFHALEVRVQPSGREILWPARVGRRPLL
ncbi:MAG: type VI secretion system baseplate subunit TssF [Nannocystaceae bacterium]